MKRYYTLESESKDLFIKLPKVFFLKESNYFKMSSDAKLLYGLLRDRNQLSIMNKWVDGEGRIFFLFNQLELAELVGKDAKTVRKYLKELEKYELLERVRQGINLPDKLYLLQLEIPESQSYQLIGNFSPSRTGEFPHQEREELPTNKKENINNKTNNNNICASEIWSAYPKKKGKATAIKKIEVLLRKHSKEEILTWIDRYKLEFKNNDYTYMAYGSTFFTSTYEDYKDDNYQDVKPAAKPKPSNAPAKEIINDDYLKVLEGEF